MTDRDVLLHTLPMFHVNGWGTPYILTGVGGRHVVLRQVDGTEILQRIAEHEVTVLCCAPAVLSIILEAAQTWESEIPGSGRVRVVVAGAPPPSRVIERVMTELGWEFCQLYGLTETSPLLTFNRQRAEWDTLSAPARARKLGRAGVPSLGTRVDISAEGEVVASSNSVLKGYWNQPNATEVALADGVFHTGDGGYVDDEGYLTISDRKKNVIVSGGENVSSIEVEDALMSHPAVKEAAVIGVPDDRWGETVLALVVVQSDVSSETLVAHCRELIAGYKVPRIIEFVRELPRTSTGKIQKFVLREPYWAGLERQVH